MTARNPPTNPNAEEPLPSMPEEHQEQPLESWKEIGTYLQRDARTVRRWEKYEGLPVHRHEHLSRSTVYAYAGELDAWRATRKPSLETKEVESAFRDGPLSPLAWPPWRRPLTGLALALVLVLSLISVGNGPHFGPEEAYAEAGSELEAKRIWAEAMTDTTGRVSPDGRYLSFVDWNSGNLAVRDLGAGQNRTLTDTNWNDEPDAYAGVSVFSPDGKMIAYTWENWKDNTCCVELRLAPLTGDGGPPASRLLYQNPETLYVSPTDWSPDGKHILLVLKGQDETTQMGLISLETGDVRVLKSFDWRVPRGMRFSPDGDYIVYDFPPSKDVTGRDIYLLTVDGSREIKLVEHPADDRVLGWTPYGDRILFTSNRTGSHAAWMIGVEEGSRTGTPQLVKSNIGLVRPQGFARDGSYYYGVVTGTSNVYTAEFDPSTGKATADPLQVSLLHDGRSGGPAFSRDGNYLSYAVLSEPGRFTQSWSLVIRNLETGAEREIPLPLDNYKGLTARWSPDGRSLLAAGGIEKDRDGLYRIDPATGKTERILRVGEGRIWDGVWSADGKSVFYVHDDDELKTRRLVMRRLATGEETEMYTEPPADNYFRDMALSPDGSDLALCRAKTLSVLSLKDRTVRDVATLPREDALNQISGVAWTPDGKHLIFSQGKYPKSELWRIPLKGGPATRTGVAIDSAGVLGLSVHPDGRQLLFHATTGNRTTSEIWAMKNFLPQVSATR